MNASRQKGEGVLRLKQSTGRIEISAFALPKLEPHGWDTVRPFMALGSGFLRAVLAVFETRGVPWIMRGSFIKLASNLAGANKVATSVRISSKSDRGEILTPRYNIRVVGRRTPLVPTARRK